MPIPESIQNAPVLLPGLEFYYAAFWNLTTDRPIGMAEGPIPWSSMQRYCAQHGVTGFDFDRFIVLMRMMDNAYGEHRESERSKSEKKRIGSSNGAKKVRGAPGVLPQR